jgi:hypothetical protein
MQENPILITRILWSVSFQFFVGKIAIKKTNIPTTGWWFGTFLFFHILGMNVIITTDELMFFRGVAQPPTRISLTVINGISFVYTIDEIDEVGGSTT